MNASPEEQAGFDRQRRRTILFFLLLPLMLGLICCAAQAGVLLTSPAPLNAVIEPQETADYSRWAWARFAPVHPILGTLIAVENGAPDIPPLFVAGAATPSARSSTM